MEIIGLDFLTKQKQNNINDIVHFINGKHEKCEDLVNLFLFISEKMKDLDS